MSLQKKYYYTFKGLDNTSYLTEIWQEITATITAEEIIGDAEPFTIEYPATNPFEPVKGSGCTLNLLSTTDRKFLSLYTANMFEYQIRLYKAGILYWCGYLDSELYSEPFNELTNYTVTFTGSDGFALLERLNYVDGSGNHYTGLSTQWQVLQNIIGKLNLPYKNIYVGLSTTCSDFTLADSETLLHNTYCNNQNWYNEDGDPETARKVLESILQPYAAYIIQDNANIYITDINTVAGATIASFKKYNSSFSYVSTNSINLNLGDLSTIKFAASDQQLNVVSGFNKQIVKYSPYIDSLIDYKDTDFSGTTTSTVYGTIPYTWKETLYSTSNTWLKYNNGLFADLIGNESSNEDETDSYLKILKYGNTTGGVSGSTLSFKLNQELPYIIPSTAKLKVELKAYFRTVTDLNGITTTADIYQGKLRCKLKIGDRQYRRNSTITYPSTSINSGWISAAGATESFDLDFENRVITKYNSTNIAGFSAIDNNWISLKKTTTNGGSDATLELIQTDYLVPINPSLIHGITGGFIDFEIYDFDIMVNPTASTTPNHDTIKAKVIDVRIKDLKLSIVDSKGKEFFDNDVEYVGYMNRNYKDEGENITILQGTSKTENSVEKAALISFNSGTSVYQFIKNWTRQGKTDCIENLLLRSIVSNYTNKRIELSATINKIDSILGCLKYQAFLPDKNLMVVGCTHNLSDSTTSVTLQELIKDNLEINKSWINE